MPAKDLGSKHTCFKCQTKFYDLKKPDPVCPKCGADQRESPALRPASESRRSRLSSVPRAIEPIEPAAAEGDLLGEDEEAEDFEEEAEEEDI
jgi:uncharacterized protein (TIGR02300 family)